MKLLSWLLAKRYYIGGSYLRVPNSHNMEYKDLNHFFYLAMGTLKNNHFFIKEYQYQNTIQQFRVWNNGVIEIRFNDEFARANGYLNREDMLSQQPDMKREMLHHMGSIPDWIMVSKNGQSFIMNKTIMN